MQAHSSHAVVIGGSIAGLIAAHVLSRHFDAVTLIDRDHLSDVAQVRKGVPQGYHAHVILRRGLDILEGHFPGLTAELRANTAQNVNFGHRIRFYIFGQWRKQYVSGVETVACSRPMLEAAVYRRVLANPRVRVISRAEVVGLCVDDAGERATGVQLRARDTHNDAERYDVVEADLIVDTSGRDSRAPEWLQALGYPAPEEVVVNGLAGYASRVYQPAPDVAREWDAVMMQPTAPAGKRGGLILPMEGGRWQVLLLGAGGDYPPTDESGFMDYARSLPSPLLYEALQTATPLTPIVGYRRTENRLRHYDKLPRYLEHFLVMGDSVCSFNPMYGQGMSVASMESLILEECLAAHLAKAPQGDLRGLARIFQKRVAGVVAMPWQLASGEDLRWIDGGQTTLMGRAMSWYIEQLLRATVHNTAVAETFTRVQNMLDGPGALFSPSTVGRVLATRLAGRG